SKRGVRFKKSTKFGIVDEVYAGFQRVPSQTLTEVIAKLELSLIGLLRDVGVRPKGFSALENHERNLGVAINDVVPELIAESEAIDECVGENRAQGTVGNLQVVLGEIPGGQVGRAV